MIGRKKETTELNKLYDKNSAEFVAIYGRRRVGKTYLAVDLLDRDVSADDCRISPSCGYG